MRLSYVRCGVMLVGLGMLSMRDARAAEVVSDTQAAETVHDVPAALERAGANRPQIEAALAQVPAEQRGGMEFLVRYMPEHDLRELSTEFLLENVAVAYQARDAAPWKDQLPEDVFFNDVLPYASINERRDRWRKDFYERFRPLVADCATPTLAAARLNQKLFDLVNVHYSTRRPKADQSPYESIEAGLASCTGLSILLIDACRAVGVPARFVGTPLWTDRSGNHSWVEVWDQGWHFTGAAEATGDELNRAWFVERASQSLPDEPRHAIYAVSYRHTPTRFPLIWDRKLDYVRAVNVTSRYVGRADALPADHVAVMFRVLNEGTRNRCAANFRIKDASGKVVYQGQTKDERFDANDHLTVPLPIGQAYRVEVDGEAGVTQTEIVAGEPDQLVTIEVDNRAEPDVPPDVIALLRAHLQLTPVERPELAEQAFAQLPLSRDEAQQAQELLWQDHVSQVRANRADEMQRRELQWQEWKLRFDYKLFGDAPADGRSLYISMHGGGGAPAAVNDRQWENQKRLYEPAEGVYLAPRAPTDTWNLWHQAHIDPLFQRLIENLIVFENVNPDRVYLLGYSAGGDGVYQVAPRFADRLAAAAMMAGHPNEASPLGLRNLPFALHMGANDGAYNRNQVAQEWGTRLQQLRQEDPLGYEHVVQLHEGKGHWMDRQDAAAIPWMAQFRRNPAPERIVWWQDDVTHDRFYWLAVPTGSARPGTLVRAQRAGQRIEITMDDVSPLRVRLNDELADLEQPVTVVVGGEVKFEGKCERTIRTMAKTLAERGDPRGMYSAEIEVTRP